MTVAELDRRSNLALNRFRLALAWSLDFGILEANAAPAPELSEVSERFVASGAARGYCRRPMYLLLLGPEHARATIDRLIDSSIDQATGIAEPAPKESNTDGGNRIFRSGRRLRLEVPDGLLVVRRQLLAGPLTSEILAALALASAVAIWECKEAVAVIERLSSQRRDPIGMLVASGDGDRIRATPDGLADWPVLSGSPRHLGELLAFLLN